jgi:hypothetical protein
MGYEAVVPGIRHRCVKKPVNDECSGIFVQLVLDRLTAQRDLDNDVDVVGGIMANLDGFDAHVLISWSTNSVGGGEFSAKAEESSRNAVY